MVFLLPFCEDDLLALGAPVQFSIFEWQIPLMPSTAGRAPHLLPILLPAIVVELLPWDKVRPGFSKVIPRPQSPTKEKPVRTPATVFHLAEKFNLFRGKLKGRSIGSDFLAG